MTKTEKNWKLTLEGDRRNKCMDEKKICYVVYKSYEIIINKYLSRSNWIWTDITKVLIVYADQWNAPAMPLCYNNNQKSINH